MSEPASSQGDELDLEAEIAISEICGADGGQPSSVCASELVEGLHEVL
jgi:hypothetical protein